MRLSFISQVIKRMQINFMIVAYRGYSESEGTISENGIKLDGKAMIDYVFKRKDIDTTKIIVLGRSLGGAVSVNALAYTSHKVAAFIIENSFTSIPDMVDKLFPMVKHLKGPVLRNYWRSIDIIDKIKCPMLFVKAMQDELIPPEMMNRLYANAVGAKSKQIVIFCDKICDFFS